MTKTSLQYLDEWIEEYTSGLSPANAAEAEDSDITTGLIGNKPLPLWRLREVVDQLKTIAAKPSGVALVPRTGLGAREMRQIPGRHGMTLVYAAPVEDADA